MRRTSRIALGSVLTLSAITCSGLFVGCGNGDDDDDNSADAGKDGTAPFDAGPGQDATTFGDAAPGDATTGDTGTGPETGGGGNEAGSDSGPTEDSGHDAGDAGDAGEDAGDAGHDAGADAGDAGDAGTLAAFRTTGRWATPTATTMKAAWPGAGLQVTYTGPTLVLNVADTINNAQLGNLAGPPAGGDYLEAYIDGVKVGAPIPVGTTGSVTISSGNGAVHAVHKAEIYKMTDGNIGTITVTLAATGTTGVLTPFTLANGEEIMPAASTFVHKIEFIGDEQTAGYGDTTTAPSCTAAYTATATTAQCDETLSYSNLVARYFNAERFTTAEAQMGVITDDGNNAGRSVTSLWTRTLPDTDADGTWTFANYTPDVVVINLGAITDEALWQPGETGATFKTALTSFLDTVYTKYGSTPYIVLVVGPEFSNTDARATTFVTVSGQAVTASLAGKAGRATTITASTYSGGCGYTPDSTSLAATAGQIETVLKAAPVSWTAAN